MAQPNLGEIWLADLDPTQGHEQAGRRPVPIVSSNTFNHGPATLVIIAPLTRTSRGLPIHVEIQPPEGGVRDRSFVLCEAVRSISKTRLIGSAWGTVSPQTISRVADVIATLLEA